MNTNRESRRADRTPVGVQPNAVELLERFSTVATSPPAPTKGKELTRQVGSAATRKRHELEVHSTALNGLDLQETW